MRRATAKEQGKALWLATRDMSDAEAKKAVTYFAETLAAKGLGSTLPDVLAVFGKASEEANVDRRVHIDSARELDDKTIADLLRAVDAPEHAEVIRSVDPALIAGVRVRTVDRTLDATAKRSIDEFRKRISRI